MFVVRRSPNFRWHATFKISHFLGALIDEQHHDMDFRMIFDDSERDVSGECGLARGGRRHNHAPGSFAEGAEQIHRAHGHALVLRLELYLLIRRNRRQLCELKLAKTLFDRKAVNRLDKAYLGIGKAGIRRSGRNDETALMEFKAADKFAGNERILRPSFAVLRKVDELTGAMLGQVEYAFNAGDIFCGFFNYRAAPGLGITLFLPKVLLLQCPSF